MTTELTEESVDASPEEGEEEKAEWSPTPIEITHPEHVEAADIHLFYEPAWKLRMTLRDDRSYLAVKVVRAAPLSSPNGYICFLDSRDEAICMVRDPNDLPDDQQKVVLEELERRYLTAIVHQVLSLRSEFGASYWEVATDRGDREFVVKDVSENAHWLSEDRVMLLDVDANRFEIQSLRGLDRKRRGLIDLVL